MHLPAASAPLLPSRPHIALQGLVQGELPPQQRYQWHPYRQPPPVHHSLATEAVEEEEEERQEGLWR